MNRKSKLLLTMLATWCLFILPNIAFSQWSDTKNSFVDSLHMPVCVATNVQSHPLIIRSYPDSGYFLIWQDQRNLNTNKTDIYAQKFDKNGNALWANDGIPVAVTSQEDHFTYPFNGNYRNYSVAATDSAGGLYITWINDSLNNYYWRRIMVQNILSDGSLLIPGQGYIVAQTPVNENYDFNAPQLIADGMGGFYIAYLRATSGTQELFAYNYKKQGGTFVPNGGGWLNEYGRESQSLGPCGIINNVTKYAIPVNDYYIWPDGQGGCNVLMNMTVPVDGAVIGFNRLARVKQNSQTTVLVRTTDIASCSPITRNYQKDDVEVVYKFRMFSNTVYCSVPGPPPIVYSQTSYYIENFGLGFRVLDIGGYDYQYAKGVTLTTDGNIDVNVVGFNKRTLTGNTVSSFGSRFLSFAVEKYDSLPYELCTNLTNCYTAVRTFPEGKVLDKYNYLADTLLGGAGSYYYDFSIAGGGNNIYATSIIPIGITNERSVFMQNLKLERIDVDSFALRFNTPSNKGVVIGKEVLTGFQTNSISYDDPMVTTDLQGNGVFYIRDYYRNIRVSPIRNGTQLTWGAMGKATATGIVNGYPYRPENAYFLPNPSGGAGLLTWVDERNPSLTSYNVYMRHIDSLHVSGYLPPNKLVKPLSFGGIAGTPSMLLGTSLQYSVVDAYSGLSNSYSPVVEILDNYNLGFVEVSVYSNTTGIRTHNGKPYLDRNYTIKVQNNPAGAANINVRLYFTTAEFDALKAADPSILNPGMLSVLKQSNNTTVVPATYTPIGGEEEIVPLSWAAVPGGYYIELQVNSFSNFFVFKNSASLPVTWVNVNAQWNSDAQAKVNWQVANAVNVDKYIVQYSKDGRVFTDACTVSATRASSYYCNVPANKNQKNYYRVKEVDVDGTVQYSKIVLLVGSGADNEIVLYPNPVSKVLNIQSGLNLREIVIIDGQGKSVAGYRMQGRPSTIDVSKMNSGVYTLVLVESNGNRHYRKIVIQTTN